MDAGITPKALSELQTPFDVHKRGCLALLPTQRSVRQLQVLWTLLYREYRRKNCTRRRRYTLLIGYNGQAYVPGAGATTGV